MSFDKKNPKSGDAVYPAYTPVKAGVIVAVGPMPDKPYGYLHRTVTVRMANGKTYDAPVNRLHCFVTLTEEHERKAAKFRKILDQLTSH